MDEAVSSANDDDDAPTATTTPFDLLLIVTISSNSTTGDDDDWPLLETVTLRENSKLFMVSLDLFAARFDLLTALRC